MSSFLTLKSQSMLQAFLHIFQSINPSFPSQTFLLILSKYIIQFFSNLNFNYYFQLFYHFNCDISNKFYFLYFLMYSYSSILVFEFFSSASMYSGKGNPLWHSPHMSIPIIFLSLIKNCKRCSSISSGMWP